MSPVSMHQLFKSFWSICFVLFLATVVLPHEVKKGLPFCDFVESSNKYVFISTLDGKLTALNPDKQGEVVWSVHLGTDSMLSCSIHKLELTNYGHMVRMIPSLSGGLYKFNGESIEAIPVTVEHLLQASFKYSDDLVISGGKESQTFGVSLQSGKILYECSMRGCENATSSNNVGDILVIQRLGQTIRAIEPRTGSERWNFSVAQHDLKLLSDCYSQCQVDQNVELRVIVPKGLIYAVDSEDKANIIWQHRFDSPIVGAWQMQKGRLYVIDLFSSFQPDNLDMMVSPSLYVGMHEKQLYVQESVVMQRKRQDITSKVGQNLISNENNDLSIPWKPVSASRNVIGLIEGKVHYNDDYTDEASLRKTTALSVLYASPYVDGSGFYLYPEERSNEIKEKNSNNLIAKENEDSIAVNTDIENDSDEDTPVQIVIISLWYWWKEVVVISLTTAIIVNVMFTRRFLVRKSKEQETENHIAGTLPIKISDSGIDVCNENSEAIFARPAQEYTSRYLTDFEPINCLGKGGFGVVFEAKNKIDDCRYAIKRIVLPVSQDSKDRVMREVKALAKLDHHHIVRYFNAWTECPPPGWQEDQDKSWMDFSVDLSSGVEGTMTHRKSIPTGSLGKSTRNYSSENAGYKNWGYLQSESQIDLPARTNDLNDSFIVFDDSPRIESYARDCDIVDKLEESVLIVGSESEESESKPSGETSRIERPNNLTFSERTCGLSCNPNKVYLYIQMQLCQRQSLKDWLTSNMEREYTHVLRIFEQILQAVEHVHLNGLIHRDLKPSNIFFSLDNEIKVGDFGLVTAMTEGDPQISPCECSKINFEKERHTAQVGTQLYMSPEQLSGKRYNYKVDIYSLGLILFELLVPFKTQMERVRVLEDIKKDKFSVEFKEKYTAEYNLLRLMLSESPDERPTTYGIRARLPLTEELSEQCWHFNLPVRRRGSSKTSTSTSSSDGSPE